MERHAVNGLVVGRVLALVEIHLANERFVEPAFFTRLIHRHRQLPYYRGRSISHLHSF